ncbi:MAG: metallophosphoesterase family protein [Promethearchaeota archaeon]
MVKIGIISDTHIDSSLDKSKIDGLLIQLKRIFKDVDEIIHAGDVCEEEFLKELRKIAPTKCVRGNMDKIRDLEDFIQFSIGPYNIGVIHEPPNDIEGFFKQNNLHILIHGHTHYPIIKDTHYKTLILNPGSPTRPKPPPKRFGFKEPIARPSVITLEIDENNMVKTFIINLII